MKMVAYLSRHRVGVVDTSIASVPHLGFEISKKKILDRKMKMVVYLSRHRVGVVHSSVVPVPHPGFEISKKNFGPKNENGRIPFKAPHRCR